MNKQEFRDALCLRYGWQLSNVPDHCVCGSSFSVNHAMICRHGGLTFIRHNELRDLTASWLQDVCHDVAVEPPLQPLHGESLTPNSAVLGDDAMADIHAGASGVDGRVHFLMLGFFIPMHPAIIPPRLHPCSEDMNLRKSKSMEIMCKLLNLPHLHLWCSRPLVVLAGRPPFFYSHLADLLASKHSSDFGICYPGCAAPYHILCYALQSCMAIRGSRTIKFSERPFISTELCLVESHIDFSV